MLLGMVLSAGLAAPQRPATTTLIVKTARGLSKAQTDAVVRGRGGNPKASVPKLDLHIIEVPVSAAEAIAKNLRNDSSIVRVESNQVRRWQGTPTDSQFDQQWALTKIGWDQIYGNVTPQFLTQIAILDTGVDASHPDLIGSIGTGTSIIPGANPLTDANGHGTWLAGIAAARTNNLTGIAGVAYDYVHIMPVKVLDDDGLGQDSDIIQGIIWAADNGASVILMAFSNPGYSQSLQEAIDYAWSKNVVLVAAAGNDATGDVSFPAGDRGVVGVSATDQDDNLASTSNFGPSVFLAAPGVGILGTYPDNRYVTWSGTSASAAIVAGTAALMRTVDPSLSNGIIVNRLARSADPAGTQDQTGNGRVNVARAIEDVSTDEIQPAGTAPVGNGGPYVGPYRAAALHVNNIQSIGAQVGTLTYGTGASATYSVDVRTNGSGTTSFGVSVTGLPSGAGFTPATTGNQSGDFIFTLAITTSATTPPGTSTFTVTIDGKTKTGTLTIGPKQITASLNAGDKTYDGTTSATITGCTPNGVLPADAANLTCSGSGATFSSSSASASPKTVTATVTLSGTAASKYAVTNPATTTATINPKPITAVLTANDKTYDGSNAATISACSMTGVLAADTANVTCTGSSATFASSNASASPQTVTATVTLSGTASGNYSVTSPATTTAKINPKSITATLTSSDKTYDGTDAATITNCSPTGIVATDIGNVTCAASTARFASVNANASPQTVTATVTLGGSAAPNYSVSNPATTTAKINGKAATVSPAANGKQYGASDPSLSGSLGGFLAADSVTATFSRSPGEAVGSYVISGVLSPVGVLGNYNITYNTASFTIAPKSASVTADSKTKTLGAADPEFTGSLNGFLAADAVTATFTRVAGEAVGTYTISASLAPASVLSNYAITYNTADLTIQKYLFDVCDAAGVCTGGSGPNSDGIGGHLTITSTVPYLGTATATVTLSPGNVAGLDAMTSPGLQDGIPLSPQFRVWIAGSGDPTHPVFLASGNATKTGPVNGLYTWSAIIPASIGSSIVPGSYTAYVYGYNGSTLSNLVQDNEGYSKADVADFQYPTLTAAFTVVKTDQTITFGTLSNKTFGDSDFTVSATASSNLAVGFAALGDCTVSGNLVHITGAGGCTITATQPGDDNFNAAPNLQQSFTIAKATATITVTPYSATYDGNAHTAVGLATGVGGADLGASLDLTGTTHTNAGTYNGDTWAFIGGTNYNDANGAVNDSIAKANPTIIVNGYAVTYDGDSHTAAGTATGAKGESLTGLDLSGTTHTNAGTYPADTWTFTDVTGNYNNSNGTTSDAIAKANASITVTGYNVTYDANPHMASGTATGVKGESLSGLDLTGTSHTNAGTYGADPWTFTDVTGNYNSASGTTSDAIAKTNAVISVSSYTGIYDGNPHGASGSASGIGGVDLSGLLHLGSTFTAVPGGTAHWTFDEDTNYNSASGDVGITISQKTATVTASSSGKIYGAADPALDATQSGFLAGDVAGIILSAIRASGQTVGTYVITPVATGGKVSNYDILYVAGTFTISKKSLTGSITAGNKPYDGTTAANITSRTLEGVVSEDDVTYVGGTASFVDKNVANGKSVAATGLYLTGADAGNYSVNTTANTTADINPRQLTISAIASNKVYDGATTASVTLSDNRVAGDVFTAGYASADFADRNVGTAKTVHVEGISLTGTDAGNYTPNTSATAKADITARPITATADAKTKIYGNPDPPLTYQITSGSLVSGDSLTGVLGRAVGENVGSYAIQQNTLAAGTNYSLTYIGASLTITPKSLTITANNTSRQYSDPNAFDVTYSGFVPGEGPSSLIGYATYTTTADKTTKPGTYDVMPGGLTSGNYLITFQKGTLTITKEDSNATYAGLLFFSTASPTSSSADIVMQATVQDATVFDPNDPNAGDIRNARVSFVNRDVTTETALYPNCSNLTPALVNPSDLKTGIVSCTVRFDIGAKDSEQYTVGLIVDNYYTRNSSIDDTVLTISKPLTTAFVTGGGYLVNQSSLGQYAGTAGAKTNFGLNVKNNKSAKNLQGNLNVIIRRLENGVWKTYQIKSNQTDSLFENLTSASTGTAQFTGKANLTDVTDPLNPVGRASGLTFQITLSDQGEPGNTDSISFSLWDGGTLMYSSNWNGAKTNEQILNGGNLRVK
jgi:subtilisin family serine protease